MTYPKARDEVSHSLAHRRLRPAVNPRKKIQRFSSGKPRVKRSRRGTEAQVAAHSLGIQPHIVAHNTRAAGGWFEDGCQHSKCGRLSRAIRAEQAENLSRPA